MGEIPSKPRTRKGRRNLAGSLSTGLHTVTIQLRKPSRYVPLMIAVGIGAFLSFGWPLIARTQGPHVRLNDAALSKLVAVHRGSADRASLDDFTEVTALILFDALPTTDQSKTQASFVVLRESRVKIARAILAALDDGGTYTTTVGAVGDRRWSAARR